MALHKAVSFQDGPRLSVSTMVKQPTIIPKRIISMLEQQFIVDALLRKLPPTQSGTYVYEESTPLFADGDAEIVEEFGEIPVVSGKVGARKVAFTVKRALGLKVSQEMINRNAVDRVNTQMTQIKNTMLRTWETVFLQAILNHPDVPTMASTAPWDNEATSAIRFDLAEGQRRVGEAAPADSLDNYYGFEADTLVIGRKTRTDLITSTDFNEVYRNNPLAAQSPEYKGTLPGEFYGLTIMVSREMDRLAPDRALLLQRKVVGGIGDERPLRSTPLYEEKRSNETWRSDTLRQSAVVIDQPKAALWITNVET